MQLQLREHGQPGLCHTRHTKCIDGLGCQDVSVRTYGEPRNCELILRAQEHRAEGTTTVDEVSLPGDSGVNVIAERAIWTVGRHMASTKVFLEENVLEGHDVGPRLTA